MNKRTMGSTGYQVTPLGIGTWGLGGGLWRDMEPRDAQRVLFRAVDAGLDFIDTALIYGDGLSETLVGEVVRELRARDWVVVASKVPPLDRHWPGDGQTALERVFPPEYVIRSVEQSLRNLRAEVVPIAQLHVWHDAWLQSTVWPDLRGAMEQCVRQGKVLHWGVSANSHDPDSVLELIADPLIETVQVIYNIYDPSAEDALLAAARQHRVGVIARCPFDEGALTGVLTRDTTFTPGDIRQRYFAGERLVQAVERARALDELCGDEVVDLPELALRFCLSQPDVAVVIPGMRRDRHLFHNLAAASKGALSPAMRERLREHTWDKNWYLGLVDDRLS
ncbi:MAG: aldo/keto reductase [Myxococcota bacterium]